MDVNSYFEPRNLKILSGSADDVFGIAKHLYACNDDILEATLRYIVLSHGEDNDLSKIKNQTIRAAYMLEDMSKVDAGYLAQAGNKQDNPYDILILVTSDEFANIPAIDDQWESLDTKDFPLDAFLSKIGNRDKHPVKTFIHKQSQNVIVLLKDECVNQKWLRTFTSALFRVCKNYYPTIESYQGDRNLFWAIANLDNSGTVKHPKTGESVQAKIAAREIFVDTMDSVCEGLDFDDYVFSSKLLNWGANSYEKQIKDFEAKYNSTLNTIQSYEATLADLYAELQINTVSLQALRTTKPGADDSLIKFFKSHKELSICKVKQVPKGQSVDYMISSTLDYYDADELKRIFDRENSYIHSREDAQGDFGRKMLKALFLDEKAKLRTQCTFTLTNYEGLEPYTYEVQPPYAATHFPHPHLVYYGCLGGNREYIIKFLKDGNWDLAIEQTIAASQNINFGDSTVVTRFMNELYNKKDECRCIIIPDGRELTPQEFSNWLDRKESEEKEAVTTEGDNNE